MDSLDVALRNLRTKRNQTEIDAQLLRAFPWFRHAAFRTLGEKHELDLYVNLRSWKKIRKELEEEALSLTQARHLQKMFDITREYIIQSCRDAQVSGVILQRFFDVIAHVSIKLLLKAFTVVESPETLELRDFVNAVILEVGYFSGLRHFQTVQAYETLLADICQICDFEPSTCVPYGEGEPPTTMSVVNFGSLPYEKLKADRSSGAHLTAIIWNILGHLLRYQCPRKATYAELQKYFLKAIQLRPNMSLLFANSANCCIHAKWHLHEAYFSLLALGAAEPFLSIRERFIVRLSSYLNTTKKIELELDKKIGSITPDDISCSEALEFWIRKSGTVTSGLSVDKPQFDLIEYLTSDDPAELLERTSRYVLGSVAMLILKIDMDRFASVWPCLIKIRAEVSTRTLAHLAAVISLTAEIKGLNARRIFRITCMFVVCAQLSHESGDDSQAELAIRFLLSLLGVLLDPLAKNVGELRKSATLGKLSMRNIHLVLPSLVLLTTFFRLKLGKSALQKYQDLEPLETNQLSVDTWRNLELVANSLDLLQKENDLLNIDQTGVLIRLPEHVVTSCQRFMDNMFSNFVRLPPCVIPNPETGLIHARFHYVLLGARSLSEEESIPRFGIDDESKEFKYFNDQNSTLVEKESPNTSASQHEECSIKVITRRDIVALEDQRRERVFVIAPEQLVPDTNAFVDHLDVIAKLSTMPEFKHIALVLTELRGLSITPPGQVESAYPQPFAQRAMEWLQHQKSNGNVVRFTLTGKYHQLFFAHEEDLSSEDAFKNNDDRILESCARYIDNYPMKPISPSELPNLPKDCALETSSLVLLTDDRGLKIKARALGVPAQSVLSFCKWAGID